MSFPRGLAVESCYLIRKPLPKAIALHQQWSPLKHPDLKVWLHGELPAKPMPDDFRRLASAPTNGPVKALIAATEKFDAAKPGVNLSAEEAKVFGAGAGPWSGAWSGVLLARAQAFHAGGLARQPAYAWKGQSISAADELAHLLKEVPKVRAQFSGLVAAVTGGSGKTAHYWELFDVDGQAAFSLGATFEKTAAGGAQTADVQYYASGGYFVLATFYQMWPVEGGTLVWRGDFIASPELGELRGMERMGSGAAMLKQIKQFVTAFLKDSQ